MPEESTTTDLVAMTRAVFVTGNRHDLDAVLGFYAPDAVWDLTDGGLGTFEGEAAIRAFLTDWWKTFDGHTIDVEEALDLGRGVTFSVVREVGRPVGSDGHVQQRRGWILIWTHGLISRVTVHLDPDEARAAAERLAHEQR